MNINPEFMDNELIKERQGQKQAEETEEIRYQKRPMTRMPLVEGPYPEWDDEEELSFGQPQAKQEMPFQTFQPSQEGPRYEEEEEIAPGLFKSDISSWKKQFGEVYMATVKGNIFIIRTLTRFEYKEIISVENTDPLMREEMICEYCVLYPQGYNFTSIAGGKAGTPAILAETIMNYSDFTRDVEVRKL